MKKRSLKIFLRDILESIERIEQYLEGETKEKFLSDYEKQDAVMKRLEVIGEAVKNVPSKFREKYPQVPWQEIAGMRDVLIHEYFGVIMERVWDTAKDDIPKLKRQIVKILASLEKIS